MREGLAYYNEIDEYNCEWIQNLMDQGLIMKGVIDRRSIVEVTPDDVRGYTRVHFFAGIGGWDIALRLAGWPDALPVWTGSCPCQSFSSAGKRKGAKDERHLWPVMFDLVRQCRPDTAIGEQVSSAIRMGWLDGVSADLEKEGYAVGPLVLGAHSVGSPHIRQRLFWVADSRGERLFGRPSEQGDRREAAERSQEVNHSGDCGKRSGLGHTVSLGLRGEGCGEDGEGSGRMQGEDGERQWIRDDSGPAGGLHGVGLVYPDDQRCQELGLQLQPRRQGESIPEAARTGETGHGRRMGSPIREGSQGYAWNVREGDESGRLGQDQAGSASEASPWADSIWIPCRDGKARRVKPGIQPLAARLPRSLGPVQSWVERVESNPKRAREAVRRARRRLALAGRNRTQRLKGYGNAIVPQVAAEFIKAYMEAVSQ
jgi:DNA (cytosine-5)-methyltransferase 1